MQNSVPTERQLNPFADDLEGKYVIEHLLGKSLSEATALLRKNSCYYGEDYTWMGPEAFVFYVQALLDYLKSQDSDGDGDFAYSMISTFRSRLDNDGLTIESAIPIMREFCSQTELDFDRLQFEAKYKNRLPRRIQEFEKAVSRISEEGEKESDPNKLH